jgi:hypothetical protein
MPLLILAIASFLLFPLIVILLCIANVLESRATPRNRALTSTQAPLFSITEAFDPVYSILWDAPIAALELIDAAGPAGIPVARLRPLYAAAAAHFPEIYEGCSFVHWLQFLEKTRLISWHGFRVVLTADGRAFLRFRFVTDAMVEA